MQAELAGLMTADGVVSVPASPNAANYRAHAETRPQARSIIGRTLSAPSLAPLLGLRGAALISLQRVATSKPVMNRLPAAHKSKKLHAVFLTRRLVVGSAIVSHLGLHSNIQLKIAWGFAIMQ